MERRSLNRALASVAGPGLPPHVSIKDNIFALVDDTGNRYQVGPQLNCVIVDMNERMSRIFWGFDEDGKLKKYDPDDQEPPWCFSDNGIAPSSRCSQPQAKSCQPDREGIKGCKWSVWGSATSLKGEGIPACTNGLKLALIMVKQDKKEWIPALARRPDAVFFFRVPPASLGAAAEYGKKCASMGKLTIPWTGEEVQSDVNYVVTRIEFAGTGKVQFHAVGYINEQLDTVIDTIDQDKVDVAIGRDDIPITALPAPEKPKEIGKAAPPTDPALPQGAPHSPQSGAPASPQKRGRGRPPKNGNAPAASTAPFEPKPNPAFVTTQDVRDHAAEEAQESFEAASFGEDNSTDQNPKFGIVESAPEPPQDVLDEYMNLDLK